MLAPRTSGSALCLMLALTLLAVQLQPGHAFLDLLARQLAQHRAQRLLQLYPELRNDPAISRYMNNNGQLPNNNPLNNNPLNNNYNNNPAFSPSNNGQQSNSNPLNPLNQQNPLNQPLQPQQQQQQIPQQLQPQQQINPSSG